MNKQKRMEFKITPKGTKNDLEITGYAVTFGNLLHDYVKFSKDTKFIFGLDDRPVTMLNNHNHENIFASTNNDTLSFSEEEKGIKLNAKFHERDRYWYEKIIDGYIWGFSIGGYQTGMSEIEEGIYHIDEFIIDEVSFTFEPADKDAIAFNKNGKIEKPQKNEDINFLLSMW